MILKLYMKDQDKNIANTGEKNQRNNDLFYVHGQEDSILSI